MRHYALVVETLLPESKEGATAAHGVESVGLIVGSLRTNGRLFVVSKLIEELPRSPLHDKP